MEQMQELAYAPEGSRITLADNQKAIGSVEGLRQAWRTGQILEAVAIKCDGAHNLVLGLGDGVEGVIPRDEGAIGIKEGTVRDIALIARAGKPVCFVITGLYEQPQGGFVAICSRRLAQEACMAHKINLLCPGDFIWARITHLDRFGCFADVGCGITALLPIDATGVSRILHPSERFSTGQLIPVLVRTKDEMGRLLLTHKELLGTWEQNAAHFSAGETVSGVVRSIEEYGIFIELAPNLTGLAELRDGVEVGMQATVYIKSIIPQRMKIKLVLVDAYPRVAGDPPQKSRYYLPTNRLNRWQYSPDCATKCIETVFDPASEGSNADEDWLI